MKKIILPLLILSIFSLSFKVISKNTNENSNKLFTVSGVLEDIRKDGINLSESDLNKLRKSVENKTTWVSEPYSINNMKNFPSFACACPPGYLSQYIYNNWPYSPLTFTINSPGSNYTVYNQGCACIDEQVLKSRVYVEDIDVTTPDSKLFKIVTHLQNVYYIGLADGSCTNFNYLTSVARGGVGSINRCY